MIASSSEWLEQAQAVTVACRRFLPGLVGVYVHGSAALGGMNPASDLDVLVITASEEGAASLGQALLTDAGEPRDLELSVVTTSSAANPADPWPFVLHVNSGEHRSQLGAGTGDPDLVAHYAVVREAGIALVGPEPADVIGATDAGELVRYLRSELRWGLEHGDQRYAVLNACRACTYAATRELMSKVDGAAWWIATRGPDPLVAEARDAQAAGVDLGPATPAARRFVLDRVADLDHLR